MSKLDRWDRAGLDLAIGLGGNAYGHIHHEPALRALSFLFLAFAVYHYIAAVAFDIRAVRRRRRRAR